MVEYEMDVGGDSSDLLTSVPGIFLSDSTDHEMPHVVGNADGEMSGPSVVVVVGTVLIGCL